MHITLSEFLTILDRFTKLLSTVNGRDKLAKLLQYGSKIAGHMLANVAQQPNKDWIDKVSRFEAGVAAGRKVTRFFRFIPGYVAAIRFIDKNKKTTQLSADFALEFVDTIQKVLMANYFMFDTAGWMSKLNLLSSTKLADLEKKEPNSLVRNWKHYLNNEQSAEYSRYSNYSWFGGLVLALALNTAHVIRGYNKEVELLREMNDLETSKAVQSVRPADADTKITKLQQEVTGLQAKRQAQMLAYVRDFADFGVALGLLNWWNPNNKQLVLGILGCISASIGWYEAW